jgi:CheY-like chemotaxis protein
LSPGSIFVAWFGAALLQSAPNGARFCALVNEFHSPAGVEIMPTVLLVDDESAVRRALRKILEHGGLSVREAGSGRDALDAIATHRDIGAVVSDFLMPEINGLDFYDALVSVAPHLKNRVVFLTGAARDPRVHDPLEQRGVPLINKLEDLHIVMDAVKLALLRK